MNAQIFNSGEKMELSLSQMFHFVYGRLTEAARIGGAGECPCGMSDRHWMASALSTGQSILLLCIILQLSPLRATAMIIIVKIPLQHKKKYPIFIGRYS